MKKLRAPSGELVTASDKGAPILIAEHGYTAVGEDADREAETTTAKEPGEKTIDELTGKELDTLAEKLKIADWNKKANVPAKREALKAHVDSGSGDTDPEDGLDDLDDEQLREKATELDLAVGEDADREALLAAIRDAIQASDQQ